MVSELYTKADVELAVHEAIAMADDAEEAPDDIVHTVLASLTPVRLPVIETCGDCGWCAGSFSQPGNACCRKGAGVAVDRAAAPPPECPLRRPR